MAASKLKSSTQYTEVEDPYSDSTDIFCNSDDSDDDPTFDVIQETSSRLSKISITKSRKVKEHDSESDVDEESFRVEVSELNEKDEKSFEKVEKLVKDGQLEQLKIDQCKLYLRKYGLRLTGNKGVLIERIKMHLEVINGGGEKKYPPSSFVLNCQGDACTGDVVMFEQKVYEMFNIASRSATGPPCGTRVVAGRIVKESYGAAKQQHTFTIEVLWSTGEKPLPPLHPLLIKGRNLYRLGTMRQRWDDEEKRRQVIQEKHSRGNDARSTREIRIKEKESRKLGFVKRTVSKTSQLKPEAPKLKTMPEYTLNKAVLQQNSIRQDQDHTPVNQTQTSFTHQYNNHQPCAVNPTWHSQNYNYLQNENHRPMHYNQNSRGYERNSSSYHWSQLVGHYRPNPNRPIGSSVSQQGQPRKWCRYYLQGTCHFGDRCKFVHE